MKVLYHNTKEDTRFLWSQKGLCKAGERRILETGKREKRGIDMKIQSVTMAYFSPCGTTKQAVCSIGAAWHGRKQMQWDMTPVTETKTRIHLQEQDLLIVGVPSFGGRVPMTAWERLKQLTGHQTPAVAVVTYGNRAFDDTLVELQDMLQSQGFMVAAGIAVVAEHSIMHQFATGRPNEEDCAQLCAFGTLILERLEQIGVQPVTLPGNHPYVERHGGGLVPLVEQRCTGCGACAEHCPTGAISVEQPMQTDSIRCISCMGCFAVCPEQARYLPEQAVKMLSEKLGAICSVRKENQLFLPEQSS